MVFQNITGEEMLLKIKSFLPIMSNILSKVTFGTVYTSFILLFIAQILFEIILVILFICITNNIKDDRIKVNPKILYVLALIQQLFLTIPYGLCKEYYNFSPSYDELLSKVFMLCSSMLANYFILSKLKTSTMWRSIIGKTLGSIWFLIPLFIRLYFGIPYFCVLKWMGFILKILTLILLPLIKPLEDERPKNNRKKPNNYPAITI